uniref:Sulfotransferase family protein n=1 Tax=Candidatus Kentrum sp. FW TaxID=2126338 RepID=A0A450SH75_9GAMM|nr:MAG: Sulfotransferase family protein [Candidatus Kentron sp. FW]
MMPPIAPKGHYVRITDNHPHLRDFFSAVFRGRIINDYHAKGCTKKAELEDPRHSSTCLIVKDIFASTCIGFVHRHFPPIKIVYLIRDPFSVVASKLRVLELGFWDREVSHDGFIHAAIYDDVLSPFSDMINTVFEKNDVFEVQFLLWCIQQYIALTYHRHGKVKYHICLYEKLLSDTKKELMDIAHFVGINSIPYEKMDDDIIYKPSAMTLQKNVDSNGIARNHFSDRQIDKGFYLLDCFGLRWLCDDRV